MEKTVVIKYFSDKTGQILEKALVIIMIEELRNFPLKIIFT